MQFTKLFSVGAFMGFAGLGLAAPAPEPTRVQAAEEAAEGPLVPRQIKWPDRPWNCNITGGTSDHIIPADILCASMLAGAYDVCGNSEGNIVTLTSCMTTRYPMGLTEGVCQCIHCGHNTLGDMWNVLCGYKPPPPVDIFTRGVPDAAAPTAVA